MQMTTATIRPYIPVLAVGAFFLTLIFILLKLIQSRRSRKSLNRDGFGTSLHPTRDSLVKGNNKKKRGKKQRPTDISGNQKPIERSEVEKSIQNNQKNKASTPTLENGDAKQLKKLDKKKNKGKKKKTQVSEEISTTFENTSPLEEAGEWKTVGVKEPKTKREKKKSTDITALSTPGGETSKPVYIPQYAVTSLPSTAKDVAPRFAKAAGEEWTEKRHTTSSHPSNPKPTISRTPISQVVIPQAKPASNWLPPTSISGLWDADGKLMTTALTTSANPSWSPSNEVILSKPEEIKRWSNESSNTVTSTWTNQGKPYTEALSFPLGRQQYSKSNLVPLSVTGATGVPLTPVCTQQWTPNRLQWSSAVTSARWGSGSSITEDWVHVNSASSSYQPSPLRQWSGIRTGSHANPPVVAQEMMKREEFLLEPEGYSVPIPDDPWNPDNFEKGAEGDWEAPEASWTNTNEEWETPSVETKPKPSYFDESSDDDRAHVAPPNGQQASGNAQTSVVGAGPNFGSSANQNVNKKQRRRRKKKPANSQDSINGTETDLTGKDNEDAVEQVETVKEKVTQEILPAEQNQTGDTDWSKAGKKKKSRARKDD